MGHELDRPIDPPVDPDAWSESGEPAPSGWSRRPAALLEVLLCSGYPTQYLLGVVLLGLGVTSPAATGTLTLRWVVALTVADTALVVMLIVYFLRRGGDRPGEVFLGSRPLPRELWLGLPLALLSLGLAIGSLSLVHAVFPDLRNVPDNPLQEFLQSPADAIIFALVAVLGAAVREELQRAFILQRFDRHLGGGWVGLVVFSAAFGLGHRFQGWDAVVVTGLLGALWGATYLVRRSVGATIVGHAGFNLAEIALALMGAGAAGAS